MRKCTKAMLSAVLVVVVLGMLMPTAQVSAQTWDPSLGWDFQCHSHTHPHFTQLTDAEIRWEMEQVNAAFQGNLSTTPTHHAYPYGDYGKNEPGQARIKGILADYRESGRVVWGLMETNVTDWYVHKAAQLKRATGWRKIKGWIEDCIADNALLHIFTHDVSESPSGYGCRTEKLAQMLDLLVEKQNAGNLTVMTMAEAYDHWTTPGEHNATVVISFDDANDSDYTTVYPLFYQRGLKGTSYITTSFIEQPGLLTWDQIKNMSAGVAPTPEGEMHVADIAMSYTKRGPGYIAHATVTIVDDNNAPVEDATVYGTWTGAYTGDVSDATDATGQVTLDSGKVRNGGTFNFTVTKVTKLVYWIYNPTKNVETSDTITCPPPP